jgi:hypothetical protein
LHGCGILGVQSLQSKGVKGKVLILLVLNGEGCERLMPLAALFVSTVLSLSSGVG